MQWIQNFFHFPNRPFSSGSFFVYLLYSSFILGWWLLAFNPTTLEISYSIETPQSLALETSQLLKELSPFQREELKEALAGNFKLMSELIHQWDEDAQRLSQKGILGIKRLNKVSYHQAEILAHLIKNSSSAFLHHLNCKMNLETIVDDSGHSIPIEDRFCRFLPQTYTAASFLLSIANPREIVALPKGIRNYHQIYSFNTLAKVPKDLDQLSSEALFLNHPNIAFVAPYSHPHILELLRNQRIPLYLIKHIDTVEEIQEALLKVGHASNHILEAQLLATFMEACFLSLDNRLVALQSKIPPSNSLKKLLYLSHRQCFALPTTKCLSGQLMARALKFCPHLSSKIPDSQTDWHIPFQQEQIIQSKPDFIIVSTSQSFPKKLHPTLHQTEAFKTNRIAYLDEDIQESPTQYIALAYFDIVQALRNCSEKTCAFGTCQDPGVERSETTQYCNMGLFPIVQPWELSRAPNAQVVSEQLLTFTSIEL